MFIRAKTRGKHTYLQIVENQRAGEKVSQRVLLSLGRLDLLQSTGRLDALLKSGLKFSRNLSVIDAHKKGETTTTVTRKIGSALLFERLWRECGIKDALCAFLVNRRFSFDVERAIFVTVMHRLVSQGSDRAAEQWMRKYAIDGIDDLELHHFYRAMFWLGERLDASEQAHSTGFVPRCVKDKIEERLFDARRDLFSTMTLVFFDTTTLYFEGKGGETLGRRGHTKDRRPDARQIVVGVVLDEKGNPVCSEVWPGNTTDVKTLIPVAKRLKYRFGIEKVCVVADRGMISDETLEKIESMGWDYILGVRMRNVKEVSIDVVGSAGEYEEVYGERKKSTDPAPLKVKEVIIDARRYIVCLNEEEARKDRYDREAIVETLREQLKRGDKSLVSNKGYRRYLKSPESHFEIDEEKIKSEERYDGKWVLRTTTKLPSSQVALQYKQLWMVEDIFRTMKTVLQSRPVYHQSDEAITGHVFCSFLSIVMRKKIQDRIQRKGWKIEWAEAINDVDAVEEVAFTHQGKTFVIRTETSGVAGKVFQAAGIALPPVLREGEKCGTTLVP